MMKAGTASELGTYEFTLIQSHNGEHVMGWITRLGSLYYPTVCPVPCLLKPLSGDPSLSPAVAEERIRQTFARQNNLPMDI